MSNQRRTFLLLGVIVAVLILGVAYAAIQNITLSVAGNVTASPDQGNFKVAFTGASASGSGGSTQSLTSETTAIMNVYGLKSVGDTRTIVYTIANTSTDITAYLSNTVTHNNTEYFEVTATLGTTTLAPVNGTTTLSVKVELIKTPISGAVSDTISVSITASPTGDGLISFTIFGGTPHYAESGMTWRQWVNSAYNDTNFVVCTESGGICEHVDDTTLGYFGYLIEGYDISQEKSVRADDVIIDGGIYNNSAGSVYHEHWQS